MRSIQKKWLNDREVANYFGIGRSTVWSWVRDGRLIAYKLGPRTTRFLCTEIDRTGTENIEARETRS